MAPDEERRPPKEAPQSEQSGVQADNGNLAQTQPQCQNEHAAQDDLSCFARLLLAEPESVVELRAIGIGGGKARICSGYFDDPGKFAAAARDLDGRAAGIYATLNPVAGGLLARANNRTVLAPPRSTSDDEIARRRLLLVDIDPVRPSGISATEAEKMAAFGVARAVCSYLDALGFPQPIKADSGNGAHIVLAVDLPADDGGLVRRVLEALAFRFDTNAACVDQAVHNPGRLTKVYGTLARKGDSTADRPHRRSRLVSVPDQLVAASREQLEALAGMGPASVLRANAHGTAGSGLNAGQYLERHGLAVHRSSPWQGGRKWVLEVCPFDTTHVDGAAFVVQFGNGAVAAGCHHNGCAGKGWHDLRDAVEPGWRDRAGASGSLGSGSGRGAGESWPEPQPLPTGLPPVLLLDTALLPNRLRPWIEDIAARIRCPVDFPAAAAMVALGSVLGRKLGLRPKQRDDWLVVANLWGGVVGRPGVLKTPGIQEALRPLAWLEKRAKEHYRSETARHAAEQLVWDVRKKGSSTSIANALKQGRDGSAEAAEILDAQPTVPVRRRYITNDSTVEKLGELLSENPNGLLAFRDELIGLLRSLDKDGQEGARAFYLEAWNGTGRFTYDRIGRGTIDIEAAIVSILGSIQPGPLSGYLQAAVRSGQGDDGLVQRFQLIVWPDVSKDWVNIDAWPDSEARRVAFQVFEEFDDLQPDDMGAERDVDDPDAVPFVRFAPDAQEMFDHWRTELERRVRSGDEHPAIESHLAKYRSLVPSLALLIHRADGGSAPVGVEALQRGIRWAVYLESHARRIYSVAVNPDLPAARALAGKVKARALGPEFALRDVYRPCWAGLASHDEAVRAVQVLLDLDWLREQKDKDTGGAPRTRFLVNPRVHVTPTGGTDKTDKSSDSGPLDSSDSASGGDGGAGEWGEA